MTRDDVRANLASWEADSEAYQERGKESLNDWSRFGWGVWQVPEGEVGALGDVEGLRALELGCGAAQFGIRVAKRGAHVTGRVAAECELGDASGLAESGRTL